ncbi:MAG: hypothetical protein LUQ20_04075 [Candidatus Methanoperedens sp.]|nr:hypothetical protein [Candidatus Methanoperedens sp.]
MPMMDDFMNTWGGINSLVIVVIIFGLISVYLCYMMLNEIKETRKAIERMEKVLKTVE